MSIKKNPSYRVEDGILLAEINDLNVNGESPVQSDDDNSMILGLPSPEVEFNEVVEDTSYPCGTAQSTESKYKNTQSSKYVKDVMKPGKNDDPFGGLIWKANIVPDDFDKNFEKNGTLIMCSPKNYDAKNKRIKPRRGNLLVRESDFFGSLVQFRDGDDEDEEFDIDLFEQKDRWAFSGILCGFPALQTLEVLKVEFKRSLPLSTWTTHWKTGRDNTAPSYPDGMAMSEVRVVLRSPPYSMNGWSKDSRGYLLWFEGSDTRKEARLTYGTNIVRQFQEDSVGKASPKCVNVHMISHRYATGDSEKFKDHLTYHSLALLEWDHGEYCTVVEVGFLGGLTGNKGRSNWIEVR
jgi:hypothetical protein